jgi:hypothetical protein
MAGVNEKFCDFGADDEIVGRNLNGMARAIERLSLFPNVAGANITANGNGVNIMPDQFDPAILFYNADSVNSIPAYGVALLNGINTDSGTPMYKTKQPDTYGCQNNWLLNGGSVIPKSSYGWARAISGMGPCGSMGFIAAYNTGDGTPAAKQRWGLRSGSYLLRKNTYGFLIQGVYSASDGLALVIPEGMWWFRGQPTADIAAGATGTVTIFYNGSTTGVTMTNVLNDSDCTVKGSKNCRVLYNPDAEDINPWQITDGRTA